MLPVRSHQQERDQFRQLLVALSGIKEEHRATLLQLRNDACQLAAELNSDIEQLRDQLYADAETARTVSERVHRQLTDAWQNNNRQLMKQQAATKRELTYKSGLKKIKVQLAALRGEQANIANQLRHDTAQAAGMVSRSSSSTFHAALDCLVRITDLF